MTDDSTSAQQPRKLPKSRHPLTMATAVRVLWAGVWESLVLAIVIQVIGTITVDILSDVLREMTPSLPLGLVPKPLAEDEPSVMDSVIRVIGQHQLAVIFGFVYVGRIATLLLRSSRNPAYRRVAIRLRRGWHFLKEHWARLVLVNAFAAFGLTMVLQVTQQFSWMQIVWQSLAALIGPSVHTIVHWLPGGETMERMVSWYSANQLKFQFWLLYSAAICDDLGLPNYKTLGQRLWQRFRPNGRWRHGESDTREAKGEGCEAKASHNVQCLRDAIPTPHGCLHQVSPSPAADTNNSSSDRIR